jgi:hypothetical protein
MTREERSMIGPGPDPNASEVMAAVDEALQGLELEPGETAEILGFANDEIPHVLTPETSYFILGSYRSPYIQRLRIVQNELNKRHRTYPFLMGDLREIDNDRLPTFRIRFHLLAVYSDFIVAVFEQDAGGEITELGKISTTPFFDDSYALPRDFVWMTERRIDTLEDVFAASAAIYFNDDLDPQAVDEELGTLVSSAQEAGVDVTRDEVDAHLDERDGDDGESVSYSWVHLNEFRLFELHDRCFPWSTPDDLRSVVDELP